MAKGFARKKLLYVLAGIVVVGILGCVVLALAMDRIVKTGIEKVGPKVTHVTMKVNAVHVSLLHGQFVLEGFEMGNPKGFTSPHCVSVGRAEVDVKLGSVLGSVVDIPLIEVKQPQLTLEFSGGHTNFGTLLDGMKKPERSRRPRRRPASRCSSASCASRAPPCRWPGCRAERPSPSLCRTSS